MKWEVPKLWPGETVILLGGGPSIRKTDWSLLTEHKVIAINDRYLDYPRAEILYFCDWWPFYHQHHRRWEFQTFGGMKVSIAPQLMDDPTIYTLKQGEEHGLSLDHAVLNHGSNSGFQAVNLAVLMGASRILLLGYDMQPGRIEKRQPPFARWQQNFASLIPPLKALGIVVVNCTLGSALHCFPQMPLQEALCS